MAELTADDDDGASSPGGHLNGRDICAWSGGTTTLVSTAPASAGGNFDAFFEGASDDGTRVFITTHGRLTPDDLETNFDIYGMGPKAARR